MAPVVSKTEYPVVIRYYAYKSLITEVADVLSLNILMVITYKEDFH